MRVRNVSVTLWLTEKERSQLSENAAWFAMTVQEYLRHAAMGGTVEKPTLRERVERRKKASA